MGMFDDLIPADPKAGGGGGMFDDLIPKEKPFLEKLGNFASKVWNDPPPSIAAARDVIKAAPQAATELTYGADPEAAREAAGNMFWAGQMGLGFRGLGGEGVAGRRISTGKPAAPVPTPVPPVGSASQEAVEAAARGGYTLPKYVATEGTVIPQVASSLKNVPWGGQPIVRTHDELLANMGRSASEIAPGAGTVETAGQAAKSGLTDYVKARSKEGGEINAAYKAVDALIDPEVRVPLTNTALAVRELRARRENARIPGDSNAVKLVSEAVKDPLVDIPPELRAGIMRRNPEVLEQPGLNYQGIKDLRSHLGDKTNFQLAAEGIDPKEKKFLYAALSKDLGKVVTEAGGPEAYSAWRKANVLHTVAKGEEKKLSKILGVATEAGPEAVFNRLITYANSNAGADMGRLRLARRAMGPEAWGEISPVLIDRLGRAAPGEDFSPGRFVTAWNKMSGAAKSELFTGQQAAALSDLFIVSKHIQDRITRFGNPSGTARGGIIGQGITGGALFAEPVSTITAMVGARLASEALSRPAVVRAATQAARASLSRNPVATRRALAALRAAVQAEGLLPKQSPQDQRQYAGARGPQLPFRQGEQMDNLMASVNGSQGYPDFHWVNPAGMDAFLASGPMSTNIEDRRDELGGFDAAAARMRRQGRRP